jgi:hypothetical protein
MQTAIPRYTYKNSKDIKIDDKDFIFKPRIEEWYKEALKNPRAINNAIFFGHQTETGKTTLGQLIAQKTQRPLFTCEGSGANFAQDFTGKRGSERFEDMIKEIETGFYTEYDGKKTKTEADKKGYILLFEDAEFVEDKGMLARITRYLDTNKNALFILVTRSKSVGDETFNYLYKSNLKELNFDFDFQFLKRNLEKAGERFPDNWPENFFPSNRYSWKLIDDVMFFDMKALVGFWKRKNICQELAKKFDEYDEDNKFEEAFIDIMEDFWSYQCSDVLERDLKEMKEKRDRWKALKKVEKNIEQSTASLTIHINDDEKQQELLQAKSHIIKINDLNEEQQEELDNLLEIQRNSSWIYY